MYARPYNPKRPVVGLDEKSKTLHSHIKGRQPLPGRYMCSRVGERKGQAERVDYEYKREGTANIFIAAEPLAGKRHVRVTERRTGADFAEQLRVLVDEWYPASEGVEVIVLVTDNLNTHGPWVLYEYFPPEEAKRIASRLEWHYTPEHGSWLNVAEIELAALDAQCLDRRIPDLNTLASEVAAWERERNAAHVTINWHFTAEDAAHQAAPSLPVINL